MTLIQTGRLSISQITSDDEFSPASELSSSPEFQHSDADDSSTHGISSPQPVSNLSPSSPPQSQIINAAQGD